MGVTLIHPGTTGCTTDGPSPGFPVIPTEASKR
jgi:hypothetical protein